MRKKDAEKIVDKLIDRLKEYRIRKKISHEKLSIKAGISKSSIGMIERKINTPTILTCLKITIALNISLSDIISEIEEEIDNKN